MPIGTGKNDPAGPRQDSSGRNASSASRPSNSGYNSARSGGNISSNGLGLRTGSTIHGNTAFGPAGGMSQGYATNSRLGSGMGPSVGSFSNFRNLDGSAMIGGGLQNRAIAARNPQQALGMLQALQAAQASRRPSSGRVGGLLDGEQVMAGPLPSTVPAAAPQSLMGMLRYARPAFPGGYTPEQLSQFRAQQSSWNMKNPTQRPYNPASSPITMGSAGTASGASGAIPDNPPVYSRQRVTLTPKSNLPSNLRPVGNTYKRVGR